MTLNRRQIIQATAGSALLGSLGLQSAFAQALEQVKIVNGFPAGGSADVTSRRLGEKLGGSAYTSKAVGQLVQWVAEASRGRAPAGEEAPHGAAVGQSSWGPTGFAILPSAAAAEAAVSAARAAGLVRAGLALHIVRARNHGATLSHR